MDSQKTLQSRGKGHVVEPKYHPSLWEKNTVGLAAPEGCEEE
jgi:hypothetical protein